MNDVLKLKVTAFFVTAFLLVSSTGISQTILIQPYLQNGNPTSIVVMWETNNNTESTVQFGLTQSLGNSTSGSSLTTLGSTQLHSVLLKGLSPGTRYYYKAQTGSWQSAIYDFVTPPQRNSEAGCNIVLMSDMQKDGGNPNIFSNLINNSLLPYIATEYGTPLSDHLQLAILPGDIVDNGNTYLQWKNDFFNPGEALWRTVPSYPAIGNHEVNSQNYFNYFHLPENGSAGYLEHWYYHDYSNVRVLSLDSNSPYRIQAQLNWVDSILNITCADTLIDFVFAEMHHPFKSELWTPGEADYTGDVVERLEAFSTLCGKPSIHFFGHTHAYSRGQSRDHNHLWVNVATSGGNIDYWGEFSNQDYDEFIVSQDEYGFVMVEVTAGDHPQFVLRRLSFGDEYNPGGNTETDMLSVRMNNAPPATPVPLFPLSTDTVSALCFTMQADGYSDPDADEHGASHWQITSDSLNFSNPVFESWKQYANWYNEMNLQINDDLTDEGATNLPSGISLWWRVRYRDKSLAWSEWSTITRIHTKTQDTLTSNLVINGGAESGISGWTSTVGVIESLNPLECSGINPFAGQKYFAVGALCVEFPYASAYQDIPVSAHASLIDAGNVIVQYGTYLSDFANQDEPSFALQFLNGGGSLISGTDTITHKQAVWTLKQNTLMVPVGTRTIRFIIMGTRFSGTDNDSYFDEIFCRLYNGDLDCSSYSPPGPANGRLYVDRNSTAYPDGENWITAYRTLGDALNVSNNSIGLNEIWIADGTYPVTTTTQRDTSYLITKAIALYGGFAGNETSIAQRNLLAYTTLLTGEIADTSVVTDNCYHVVRIQSIIDTVLLDGLHICCGYADGFGHASGGGAFISSSNIEPVMLHQCRIEGNYGIEGSSISNQAKIIIDSSLITNDVIEGVTGCSILNSGVQANLLLNNTTIIQQCTTCPDVIRNVNGAFLKVSDTVTIEKQ